MEYCEKCKVQCPEGRCPVCGSDRLREVQNNDYCLLTECSRNFGEMVRDVFEQNGIQGAFVPFGSGTRSALGLDLEQYRIYVPYERQEEARQIVECFCFDNTEDWREQLLANRSLWHVKKESALKKMLMLSVGLL